jgi:activator of 2-hydroxyglutaryl-CoA dehydratase
VDIGGQDSKTVKLDAQGKRTSFKMNRAVTDIVRGLFDSVIKRILEVASIDDFTSCGKKTAAVEQAQTSISLV